jgi:hypothetical protein
MLCRQARRSLRRFLHLGRRQLRRLTKPAPRAVVSAAVTEPAKISPLGLVCYRLLGKLSTVA